MFEIWGIITGTIIGLFSSCNAGFATFSSYVLLLSIGSIFYLDGKLHFILPWMWTFCCPMIELSIVIATGVTLKFFDVILVMIMTLFLVFRGRFTEASEKRRITWALTSLECHEVLHLKQTHLKVGDSLFKSRDVCPGRDNVVVAWRETTNDLGYQHVLGEGLASIF